MECCKNKQKNSLNYENKKGALIGNKNAV